MVINITYMYSIPDLKKLIMSPCPVELEVRSTPVPSRT